MAEKSLRDSFFDRLYEEARINKKIIVISADMGAPSLDKFRSDLGNQFINTGIAEASAITFASGLAREGRKPYVYAIMPFVTSRIHEFIKLEMGLMKLPVTVVGVGVGYSYDDSGPTHHTLEDISIMRNIPNLSIFSPSDGFAAEAFASQTAHLNSPAYVRLDRAPQETKYNSSEKFEEGFSHLIKEKDTCIVATANTVDMALGVARIYKVGVIDLYKIKPLGCDFKKNLLGYKNIITVEEHMLAGGIGSIVSEIITDNNLPLKLRRIGVNDEYTFEYGGRRRLQDRTGVGFDDLLNAVKSF